VVASASGPTDAGIDTTVGILSKRRNTRMHQSRVTWGSKGRATPTPNQLQCQLRLRLRTALPTPTLNQLQRRLRDRIRMLGEQQTGRAMMVHVAAAGWHRRVYPDQCKLGNSNIRGAKTKGPAALGYLTRASYSSLNTLVAPVARPLGRWDVFVFDTGGWLSKRDWTVTTEETLLRPSTSCYDRGGGCYEVGRCACANSR